MLLKRKPFPYFEQPDQMDCGPTCLRMVAKFYGKTVSLDYIRGFSETTREGSSLKALLESAEHLGFNAAGVKLSYRALQDSSHLPAIIHWQQYHFVVVYKMNDQNVWIADPAKGLLKMGREEFIVGWMGDEEEGIALLMETTEELNQETLNDGQTSRGFGFLYSYLFRYKRFLIQLIIGLLAGSLLQLLFPFLTQSVVDVGIRNQDIDFIYLILFAQVFLFLGRSGIELVRGWILLHLSTRINISLISDFFIKLMNLPIGFFDVKMTGDIMQRIADHGRIEELLTNTTLNILFSFINLVVFGGVLAWYSLDIFLVFTIGSLFYFLWVSMFLKKRRELDYEQFGQMGREHSKVIELIGGIQEIKLHNAETQKRWEWEDIQARLFRIEIKNLILEQKQMFGSTFINEIKNILITFIAAKSVVEGDITLGMMMAVMFIIGQLNTPIHQLIGFVYTAQDARIALERLSEIHNRPDEEEAEQKMNSIPDDKSITVSNLTFKYPGTGQPVLKDLDLTIPAQKLTAIVGASGSGKTTLMKILLKFYEPDGVLQYGDINLGDVSQKLWRSKCGVVMQDGFIFNDTIRNNVTLGDTMPDEDRFQKALEIAYIKSFVDELPLKAQTKIGTEGLGMSAGQKQRLLIARAVYKDPSFILFDEATSALDSTSERIIMENLNTFFKGRTAVVIAHRLSTVKNADQIVVLHNGLIAEKGTHKTLIENKGAYFNLVKNQLDLETLNDES